MSFRNQSGQPEVELTAGSSLSSAATSRQDRVDALHSQIEAGTYVMNPHAVANAMVQDYFRAEDEFVRDPGSCPIDRLPPSECLALGRCGCNRRNRGLRTEARPLAG